MQSPDFVTTIAGYFIFSNFASDFGKDFTYSSTSDLSTFAEKTIVGYCLRKGLLSGGSPALAKTFYPKCQEDDYKAIIKGKNGDNATFKALEPLLDKYIK